MERQKKPLQVQVSGDYHTRNAYPVGNSCSRVDLPRLQGNNDFEGFTTTFRRQISSLDGGLLDQGHC